MDLTLRACLLCLLLTGVCGQCYGPKDPGTTGQEPGIRYFYDTAKKACFPFAYNGQGGNSNNHFSDAACRCTCLKDPAACRQVVPTRASCRAELDRGTCAVLRKGWYYNVTTMKCRKTNYGCSLNMFPDRTMCQTICRGVVPPGWPSFPKRCILPKRHGKHGPDVGQRFYFDTATKTCLAFHYNGARGNNNRFDTKKDCKCICLQTNCG